MFQIVKDRCFRFQNWGYQNVSNEVISAWFKFQAKIPTCSPLFNDEGLKDIGHKINIGNLILAINSVMVSYLICYKSLLQNAADVYYKMR